MGGPFPHSVSTFTGRRAELDRISGLLADENLFVVYGPPGIGKSELVYRAVERARDGDRLRDAAAVEVRPRECARTELAGVLGCDPSAEAIAAALEASPHIVFVDDAEACDPTELGEILGYLTRHVRRSAVFVASKRRLELPPDAAGAVLTELAPLEPGDTAELSRLLAQRIGTEAPDPAELHDRTFGNPGAIQRAMAGRGDDDLLAETFGALGDDERKLLLLATVVGDANLDDLADAAELTPEVAAACAASLADQFLIERRGGSVHVPPMIAAAFERRTPEAQLIAMRRSAAGLHSGRFLDDPEGHSVDAVAAIRQLLESGDPAGAWKLVRKSYGAIAVAGLDHLFLEHIDSLRDALPDDAMQIDLLRVRVLLRQCRPAEAREVLDRLDVPASAAIHPQVLLLDASCSARMGQVSSALEALDRARDETASPSNRLQCELLAADIASLRGDSDGARKRIDAARRGHPNATRRELARADFSTALSYFAEERFDDASSALRRALPGMAPEDMGDFGGAIATIEVVSRVERDDVRTARAAIDAILARVGDPQARNPQLALLDGIVRYAEGDMVGARDSLRRAFDAGAAARDVVCEAVSGNYLGRAMLALGELDGGVELLARTTATATAADLEHLALRCRALHAHGLLFTGKVSAARRRIEATVEAPELTDHSRAMAMSVLARAQALEGDLDAARRSLDAIVPEDCTVVPGPLKAALDLAWAELEMLDGTADVGIDAGRRARHYYADAGRAWLEARAALALAACYVNRGGDAALVGAERELERAIEIATQRDYEPLLLRAASVEAGLARRRGNTARARDLLVTGLRRAHTIGGQHLDIQLLRAALDPTAVGDQLLPGIRGIVSFLGLSSGPRFEVYDRGGRRSISETEIEREVQRRDLFVDTSTATITVKGGEALKKRPTVCAVLARLIEGQSQGVDAETLYCDVWGAKEYQPLKHRNTVYVTLNRVRRSLEELLPGRTVIEKVPSGWRIADDVDAAAVRRLDGDSAAAS